jgi:restriction system protein
MGQCYRRDPDAALDDMCAVAFADRAAYVTVIELIHARGGAIPDDDAGIARRCGCEAALWRRIRARLIDLGKLYVDDGWLRSPFADKEAAAAQRRRAVAQAAGRASGAVRAAGPSRINDLGGTDVASDDAVPPIVRARAEARAGIKAHLATVDPHAIQHLVAALLQAKGYVTQVSPPGPDGGTDVLALPDPFGSGTPHIRVQVKHRSGRAEREEIAALRGILRPDREVGLFVSFGGFTRDARREAAAGTPHVRLIDLDGFVELWARHLDALPATARAQLPLAPVWFLDEPACFVGRVSSEAA